jgi:PilZ domain-containing protein
VPEEKSKSAVFFVDRRRSERRVQVNVPVEVSHADSEGRTISEHTFIEDVSDFGCRFTTRSPAKQGETCSVTLLGPGGKSLPDEQPRLYEIMWVAAKGQHFTMGARLLKGDKLVDVDSQP